MSANRVRVLTFDQALAAAEHKTGPHLLLGNGFSIACRPHCFEYGALLDEATFEEATFDVRVAFDLLGTTDFEQVIELLRLSSLLVGQIGSDPSLAARLAHDAEVVRNALAKVLAARHPDVHYRIEQPEYQAARRFLANFKKIYTLNYDMLLYWTLMHSDLEPAVKSDDGFGSDDEDEPYVVYRPYSRFDQNVFYLHGGLHLYDQGAQLCKLTWSRTGTPLVDQIREALADGRYPLVVTEGSSDEKEAKVLHSAYLTRGLRSFGRLQGSLFIYGHSLAANDEHVVRRIEEGKQRQLFVSLYGDPTSDTNQRIIDRANEIAATRHASNPLAVNYYDAKSANVWRAA